MDKIEINNLTLEELKSLMVNLGVESFRGEQIFSYFHKNKDTDLDGIYQLPKNLREKLKDIAKVRKSEIYKRYNSKIDNTVKYLILLEDNNIIETVVMGYKHGYSICISSQVGCKMGCSFCASTKDGFIRNLTPAEMLNQIYLAEKDLDIRISNIVLMGSGEPLDNYENVLKFIKMINHPKGHNISLRNITVSTCGIVPRIYDLVDEELPITLSISLHSPFDEERKKIMQIARKYSISELMKACRYYCNKTNRRITFEYTLIENINDRDKDIFELSKILKGIKCHVNLIPLNPIQEYKKKRPSRENVERVKKELTKYGIPVTIRREMGGDISASCGQLRRSVTQVDK